MCNNNNVVYRIEESLLSLFTSCKRAAHLYKKNIAENSIQLKNTRLLFVCVNVNMLVLRDDLRSSWKFWQFWIILYVSILILYIRRSILSRIEHPLWLYAFNFNEKTTTLYKRIFNSFIFKNKNVIEFFFHFTCIDWRWRMLIDNLFANVDAGALCVNSKVKLHVWSKFQRKNESQLRWNDDKEYIYIYSFVRYMRKCINDCVIYLSFAKNNVSFSLKCTIIIVKLGDFFDFKLHTQK